MRKNYLLLLLGFNAVAVIDIESSKTIGLIPTGWGPSRVMLGKDEKELYIITARGLGAGPNGGAGYKKPHTGNFY
jgi:DNA-binding beta-propeller fold protein YncE